MIPFERVAVLISLLEKMDESGSWCGETHIQKTTYFLQALAGVPTGFRYILYKHGPFSFELRDQLTAMLADEILKIRPRPYPYGPSFCLGATAQAVKERYWEAARRYAGEISFVSERLSDKTVADLERLATSLYVTVEEMPEATVAARARRLRELKPHIGEGESQAAIGVVDELARQFRVWTPA